MTFSFFSSLPNFPSTHTLPPTTNQLVFPTHRQTLNTGQKTALGNRSLQGGIKQQWLLKQRGRGGVVGTYVSETAWRGLTLIGNEEEDGYLELAELGGLCGGGMQLKEITIAVDIDEVLGRFLFSLNNYCKEVFGVAYDIGDYPTYEYAKTWGCTTDEANRTVHDFFESGHFLNGIPTIPGAYETLRQIKACQSCNFEIITSRQNAIRNTTQDWIRQNFPDVFDDRIHFCNHYSLEGKQLKKSQVCKAIGATVIVDDNARYAIECAKLGIHVLLYNWNMDYPWSQLPLEWVDHPFITIVTSWEEVEIELLKIMMSTDEYDSLVKS